jgi:AcrR family transcriptional regulator
MSPGTRRDGQEARSFIETARRAQIVECAIDTIAEVGYANASMERIAKRANISRGLISYHFAGKDELMAQVLTTVYADGAAFMGPRIGAETTAAGRLRAYVESNLEYMRAHPRRMAATVALVVGGALADDLPGIDPDEAEGLAPLEELLRQGQAAGEFRDFDPTFMARAIRNVIDGIPPRVSDPGFDMNACIRELTTLVELATRSGKARPSPRPARRDDHEDPPPTAQGTSS